MKKLATFLVLAIVSCVPAMASADLLATHPTGGLYYESPAGTIGTSFIVASTSPLSVYQLGIYDYNLSGPHTVGLWDSVGHLLVSATIPTAANTVDGFKWVDIPSVVLSPSGQYTVGAYYPNTSEWFVDSATISPLFHVIAGVYHDDTAGQAGLYWPTDGYNQSGFFSANLSAAPVPEPATVFLLGMGILGLAGFRKRVHKA